MPLNSSQKAKITNNLVILSCDLDPTYLTDIFQEKFVFNHHDVDRINACIPNTQLNRNKAFFDLLFQCEPKAYDVFVLALKTEGYKHLADLLEKTDAQTEDVEEYGVTKVNKLEEGRQCKEEEEMEERRMCAEKEAAVSRARVSTKSRNYGGDNCVNNFGGKVNIGSLTISGGTGNSSTNGTVPGYDPQTGPQQTHREPSPSNQQAQQVLPEYSMTRKPREYQEQGEVSGAGPVSSGLDETTRLLLQGQNLLISTESLRMGELLGKGHFGSVFKGYLTLEEEKGETLVAVKTLHKDSPREIDVQAFTKEALIMKDFNNPNVLSLIGICLGIDDMPLVVLPFIKHGDLLSYIRDDTHNPTIKDLINFAIDIAEGMAYLSSLKFVHRDLAARNCMLDEEYRVKVADFGLSRDIYEKDYYTCDNKKTKLPVKWMAIESLEKGKYSTKSDVWSYGIVLWELLTRGVSPYPGVDNWDIVRYLKQGRRMPQPHYCPDPLYTIMCKCWMPNSHDRPKFADLVHEIRDMITMLEQAMAQGKDSTNIQSTYVNMEKCTDYHYTEMLMLQDQNLLISRESLRMGELLGKGHFGSVFKGYLTLEEEKGETLVAVKTLHKDSPREIDVQAFTKEALVMKDFNNPNVLSLIGICLGIDDMPLVVLPFIKHGDLLSYIRDDTHNLTIKDLINFAIDIAEGMAYLSSLKFVHRDLAARNCMLDEEYRVKVADFGLSRDIYEKDYYTCDNKKTKLPVKWMAIESLEKGKYSTKSDVWSYGIVLWELLTRGVNPYPEVDNWDIVRYLKQGRRMPQPHYCPDPLYTIMCKCWMPNSHGRPTFADLVHEIRDMITMLEQAMAQGKDSTNIQSTYVNMEKCTDYHYTEMLMPPPDSESERTSPASGPASPFRHSSTPSMEPDSSNPLSARVNKGRQCKEEEEMEERRMSAMEEADPQTGPQQTHREPSSSNLQAQTFLPEYSMTRKPRAKRTDDRNPGNGALGPPGPDNSMDDRLLDDFEFDILILHTDDDSSDAYSFGSHLMKECGADKLKVITWAGYCPGKSMLQGMEDVFSKTRYIFIYVTEKLIRDGFVRFLQQASIYDSFTDPVKNWRIVPVHATQEKIDIFELNLLGCLKYSDWMLGTDKVKNLYLTTLQTLIRRGRTDIQMPKPSSSRSDRRLVD